ncbi:MAG: nucleotidyltransferase domain-containing protein [Chloroflexi bacterium]|nr:nucleotidyltransferase domain-containing protein [Chloroflexota bacterium]
MIQDPLRELTERLEPIFEKHHVLRAIVFGSWARGDVSRHSDFDLILIQETEKRFLDRYDNLLGPITQAIPGRAVDVLIYTPQELARIADRPFIARALREGKTIYESAKEPA